MSRANPGRGLEQENTNYNEVSKLKLLKASFKTNCVVEDGKDLRGGLADQMPYHKAQVFNNSLHKGNSLLDKNIDNVGLSTIFLVVMSMKIFSY